MYDYARGRNVNKEAAEDGEQLAHDIITKGADHPALKAITKAWSKVEAAIAEAKRESVAAERHSGTRLDPKFVVLRIVPALKDYARTVTNVSEQIEKKVGSDW